jgi:hypothetical protein
MAQWQSLLETSLAQWNSSQLPTTVYNMYKSEATIAVQRAYDDFNTDYGLTCANAQIAIEAKKGAFTKPIYLFFNQWPPEVPIVASSTYNITWAFHTWDYRAAFEMWLEQEPAVTDSQLSKLLQTLWYDFMLDGKLDKSTGWLSVEDVTGFPDHYGTFMIATPSKPPYMNPTFMVDYKTNTCAYLKSQGFDARFWWVN